MPCMIFSHVKLNHNKVVEKLVKQLPGYLKHAKRTIASLAAEVERLSKTLAAKT